MNQKHQSKNTGEALALIMTYFCFEVNKATTMLMHLLEGIEQAYRNRSSVNTNQNMVCFGINESIYFPPIILEVWSFRMGNQLEQKNSMNKP